MKPLVVLSLFTALLCPKLLSAFQTPPTLLSRRLSIATTRGVTTPTTLIQQRPLLGRSTSQLHSVSNTNDITTFFLQTLIANGVPAVLTVLVLAIAALLFKRPRDMADNNDIRSSGLPVATLYNDLYGDQLQPSSRSRSLFSKLLGPRKGDDTTLSINTGIPALEYFSVTHWNAKLQSYNYTLTAATQSKAQAAFAQRQLARENLKGLGAVSDTTWRQFQALEEYYLKQGWELAQELTTAQSQLIKLRLEPQLNAMDGGGAKNETSPKRRKGVMTRLEQTIRRVQTELIQLELEFLSALVRASNDPSTAVALQQVWLGNVAAVGRLFLDAPQRPLQMLQQQSNPQKPILYVTRFPGDPMASQVAKLREAATAIVRHAKTGDEVMVVLQSSGGTVTGYGLATAQLLRLKEAGLKLTIAVEQVAASGGYMMCCVADTIVASPFAVLGSIGVISDIPNVYERLKQEGIEFQTVTAGKYKRTLTPTKKVTKEDFEKTKQDIEDVFILFRDFVAENRPQLDIDKVATGETWFGKDALDRNLCDELKTVDSVLVEYVDKGFDVYEIEYQPPDESVFGKLLPMRAEQTRLDPPASGGTGMLGKAIRWLVRTIATEVRAELGEQLDDRDNLPLQKRFMAQDERSDRVRTES